MKFIQAGVTPKTFLSRGTRLVLVGGLTAGVGFGAVTGIASAATGHSSSTKSGSPGPVTPPGPPGGPMGGPGAGGPSGGPGGGGTITSISVSKLILRTLNGTETVETSSSTSYYKEMQTISRSDLTTGEVVHVMGSPASAGSSGSKSSTPPQPGTGTVDARRITVVEPTFSGRVQSKRSNNTFTIVGGDGQLLTVDTTSSTRYYKGASKTTSSAITYGTRIVAEGPQSDLTTLSAAVISVAPAPPAPASPPAGSASPPKPPSPASAAS